jgi:hypothetical protein
VELGPVELLQHRAAIADLVHRYALYVRQGRERQASELFTDDAVFEHWQAVAPSTGERRLDRKHAGREEILASLVRTAASGVRLCPMIHNLLIDVLPNAAESTCVLLTVVLPDGPQILGEYHDTYRYESRWRFTSRSFTKLGTFNAGGV